MKKPDHPSGMRQRLLRGHLWLMATLVPPLVKLLPLKPLLRLLTPPVGFAPYRGVPAEVIAQWVACRLQQPRNMRRRACLRHGLTLYHLLRLAGWPAVLRIGVFQTPRESRRMHAHCWVTLEGACFSPPPEGPAPILLTYPPVQLRTATPYRSQKV